MTESRAWWIVHRGRGELRAETLAPVAPGQVQIGMIASGISRGTENLVLWGRIPESERARMRCPFQEGAFPWPVKYGYAAVGRIESGARRGERVFVLHPHQDRFVVPEEAVTPIPAAVSDARATLAANMETALNGVWDAEIAPGEKVAVIGAGVVGLLVGCLVQQATRSAVRIVDPDPARCDLARDLGLDAAISAAGEFDVIIHASGHPDGLVAALDMAAFEARIIELSWYGDRPVTLPLGGAFHSQRLRLISSQVGHVARPMRGRVTHAERMRRALAALADPRFDRLLGPRVAFDALPQQLPALLEAAPTPPHIVVTY